MFKVRVIIAMIVATYPMNDNSVRNFTFEQFFDIFKTAELDISHFWMINSGFDKDGNKKYAHLVLRACAIRPLFGPHLVSVFELPETTLESETVKPVMRSFWVHSLTDLRRTFFCFRDRLSFERSTYLIPFCDGQLLIRLKSIRAFLRLPRAEENSMALFPVPTRASTSMNILPTVVEEEEGEDDDEDEEEDTSLAAASSPRETKMRSMLNHHVQVMISYLNREMQQDTKASVEVVRSYVAHYCNELDSLM
jgi:hypothetical protein